MGVKKTVKVASVPVFLDSQGQYDVEYKLYCGCRDGKIYIIRAGEVATDIVYSIESKPLGMVRLEKTLLFAGMNNNLYSFFHKGKKNFIL